MDNRHNLVIKDIDRQRTTISTRQFQNSSQVTATLIKRLGLEYELTAHTGCVNCLEWSDNGSLLASGSDDCQVIIWNAFERRKLATIATAHTGNIFSVKFLPNSGDNVVVSGAADHKILVHDVNLREATQVFTCHAGRVKRLATAPNIPFMFWSASEDGTVRQFDLRCPELSSDANPQNVLINLHAQMSGIPEAKCLAVSPTSPDQLVVGTNDPYLRLYDRRMLSCRSVRFPSGSSADRFPWDRSAFQPERLDGEDYSLPAGCVQYYIAGHLPAKHQEYRNRYRNLAATYATFSPDGRQLLVNMGGEQVYLFDINQPRKAVFYDPDRLRARKTESCVGPSNGLTASPSDSKVTNGHTKTLGPGHVVDESLPVLVDSINKKAKEEFELKAFSKAIYLYNEAIYLYPHSAKLYGNRAAAYLQRKWDGDVYAALQDCYRALELEPNDFKAHFRLAKSLYELHLYANAKDCLSLFIDRFPDSAASKSAELLKKDIDTGITNSKDKVNSATRPGRKDEEVSASETACRAGSYDYQLRFCGHCNTTTDIKEANFFGSNGQYIMAGSDDGSFFIWEKSTTNIVRVLKGDTSIVNCLQPHPSACVLATSGIDPVIRLWTPRPEDGQANDREVCNQDDAALANQRRMNADPLEVMLINMGYGRLLEQEDDRGGASGPEGEAAGVPCRTS